MQPDLPYMKTTHNTFINALKYAENINPRYSAIIFENRGHAKMFYF